jgi:hypothetical protein
MGFYLNIFLQGHDHEIVVFAKISTKAHFKMFSANYIMCVGLVAHDFYMSYIEGSQNNLPPYPMACVVHIFL